MMDVPHIGCSSHIFQLAVSKWLEPHEKHLAQIQAVMVALSYPKQAGILRNEGIKLAAVTQNVTRWSSTYSMSKRYMLMKDDLHKLVSEKKLDPRGPVSLNLLSLAETEVMSGVLNELEKMEKVSKILQKDECTIWEARHIFDWAINQWPSMAWYLGKSAKIVSDPYFLSGV